MISEKLICPERRLVGMPTLNIRQTLVFIFVIGLISGVIAGILTLGTIFIA